MCSKPQAGRVYVHWLSGVYVKFNQEFVPDIHTATIFSAYECKSDDIFLDFLKPVEWAEFRTYRLHEVLNVYVLVFNKLGSQVVEFLL